MVQAVHLPTPTYAPAIISLDHLEPQPWSSPSDAAREHHSPAPRYRAGHHRPRHEDTKVKGTNSRVAGGKFLGEEETPTVPLAGWVGAAADCRRQQLLVVSRLFWLANVSASQGHTVTASFYRSVYTFILVLDFRRFKLCGA
jgi:hypothetical protein